MTSGVVLAAGPSRRFGEGVVKQLLDFDGTTLIRGAVLAALDSALGQVVVVVGHQAGRVGGEIADLAVEVIENPDYAAGQSSSVRAGLAAIDRRADAAVFIPCDQPFLNSETIDIVLDTYRRSGGPIVVPACEGRRGAPVLFDRSLFAALRAIQGDAGGRQLFAAHEDKIVEAPLDDGRPLLDIDTPDAYQRLLGALPAG